MKAMKYDNIKTAPHAQIVQSCCMNGSIDFFLPPENYKQAAAVRKCLYMLKKRARNHDITLGVYSICDQPTLPALHTDLVHKLLTNISSGELFYLYIDDMNGFYVNLKGEGSEGLLSLQYTQAKRKMSLSTVGAKRKFTHFDSQG